MQKLASFLGTYGLKVIFGYIYKDNTNPGLVPKSGGQSE